VGMGYVVLDDQGVEIVGSEAWEHVAPEFLVLRNFPQRSVDFGLEGY
jgi:hypothetical protein